MILFVFLPLLVTAEWVEITQNYRKENKPTRQDYTNKNIYSNHSIVEHQWSKGHVHRINNPSIKKIQTNERKTTKIERNPFHEDFMTTEKPTRRIQIKDIELFYQASKVNQRISNENISINKHDSSTELDTKTIKLKTKPETNEEDERYENSLKVKESNFENVGNRKENTHKGESTPCPDDFILDCKNTSKTQKRTINHNEKIKPKTNAIETLIKFLKVVSQTIKHGTRRTFKSKIRYLEDLRDDLLANIEARIDSTFPDDTVERRRRRTSGAESRGHVEFPSSESALMTISFLTFAVFLIKLVLQVIHTYKAKTMMVTPAVVATVGRAVLKKSTQN